MDKANNSFDRTNNFFDLVAHGILQTITRSRYESMSIKAFQSLIFGKHQCIQISLNLVSLQKFIFLSNLNVAKYTA